MTSNLSKNAVNTRFVEINQIIHLESNEEVDREIGPKYLEVTHINRQIKLIDTQNNDNIKTIIAYFLLKKNLDRRDTIKQ